MGVDTESIRSLAAIPDAASVRATMHAAADEIDALRAEVGKLRTGYLAVEENNNFIRKKFVDLDEANDALRAEVERLKTKAEIGEFVMEAVRQSARNKSTITAIVRLKDSPCKP